MIVRPPPRARIVLHWPLADPSLPEPLVEASIARGVALIAAAGAGARDIEDEIDWIVVGDGEDNPGRVIVTTAHDTFKHAHIRERPAGRKAPPGRAAVTWFLVGPAEMQLDFRVQARAGVATAETELRIPVQ